MNNWYEVLKSFDETAKGKAKAGKYHQGPAVLALMYLSLGKDYPYNMARVFQSSLSIEKSGFSVLFHNGKIASLLKEMEEKHLLIRVPDPRLEGRPRNYYKINPMIIHSDKNPHDLRLMPEGCKT
jgi:hypothetical protein